MDISLRPARPDEAAELSDLAMRSKRHWGYDDAFMDACQDALTVDPTDCDGIHLIVAEIAGEVVGFHRLAGTPPQGELADLFVDTDSIGRGVGRALIEDAQARARRLGLLRLFIEADPHATGFYRHIGAQPTGATPSGSVPGRMLPTFELTVSFDAEDGADRADQGTGPA